MDIWEGVTSVISSHGSEPLWPRSVCFGFLIGGGNLEANAIEASAAHVARWPKPSLTRIERTIFGFRVFRRWRARRNSSCGTGCAGVREIAAPGLAAFFDPLAQDVLFGEIFLGCGGDDRGPDEAVALPGEAAVDHPAQDGRPFGAELLLEVLVRGWRLVQERARC